jgi:tripartite-type tricarboxylate transporter receptor subunit TctC
MNLQIPRLFAAAAGLLALLADSGPAPAQPANDYPAHAITVVVPYPPGGPADVIARIVASGMEPALGKAVIIENKSGAATALGAAYASRAQSDGYTLLAVEPDFMVVPSTQINAGYDPVKSFRPVSLTARTFQTLGVATNVPATSVWEFIQYANAHPDEIKIGHAGVGTPPYLGALSFVQATGARILLVPYRGVALVVNDVAGGHVSGLFTGPSTTATLAREGKLRILGVTGRSRLAALPDTPTFLESGIEMKGVNDGLWFGLVAPAGTPDAIIARLNAAVETASRSRPVIERLQAQGIDPARTTPEAMGEMMAGELTFWHDALLKAGVKPE